MSDEHDTEFTNVSNEISIERRLSEAAGSAEELGAARLRFAIDSKGSLSLRQSAFDCLEIWVDHPNHIEPLYSAAFMFLENNDVDLALMAAEFAMTMQDIPQSSMNWPMHEESNSWHLEVLYARILVRKDRVEEAMAYYGSVLSNCEDSVRHTIREEVVLASHRLPLCEVNQS